MTESYWQIRNRALRRSQSTEHILTNAYDIAVIGGGLMGIAVAHYLSMAGCERIVVLEKEFVGYGASGRNAGFLLSGMAEPYSRLVVGMGHESAKKLMQATIENHDLIAEAIKQKNIRCDYQRSGSYHLSLTDVECRELMDSVDLLKDDGFQAEYFDARVLRDNLRFGDYMGGYYNSGDGCLDPYAFVNGLAQGLDIIEGFDVTEIRKSDGMVNIDGSAGSVKAEMAILAINAYSPLLDNHFKELVFPVRGQMLATAPFESNPLRDKPCYANFGYDYFRQAPDDSILMGGLRNQFATTEIGYDDITTSGLQEGLEGYICKNININDFQVTARWGGVMGNTVDGLPLIGPLPHNNSVIAAVGCNGHGFGLWMIVARDLANAIMKSETSDLLKRFSIKRFLR